MSEPWFRMHANIGKRKVTARLMDHAKIRKAEAVGYLSMFWGALSQHCPGGVISDAPDSLLEEWAEWKGKRGLFAAFVRDKHSTDGKVNDYEEYSGKLEERKARDRERKLNSTSRRNSDGTPQEIPRNSDGIPEDVRRNSSATIRDDTRRYETESSSPSSAHEVLADRLPETHRLDLSRLLLRVESPESWIAEMAASLDGMHGPALAPDQLGQAIRDYSANGAEPNMRLFRGYLRDAAKPVAERQAAAYGQQRRLTARERTEANINAMLGKTGT